ncbi:MAG: hypothetical protein ACRDCY_06945, partial [Aeromonas veronii]
MFKKPVAVELEAINQEGEIQVVRDSGLTVQGYSVYLRVALLPKSASSHDFPCPGNRYTRGFLTGRPRVFSLFMALTYAMTSPTW